MNKGVRSPSVVHSIWNTILLWTF